MGASRTLKAIFSYSLAAAIIVWVARGVSLAQLLNKLGQARLRLFIPVTAAVFFCWFLGETLLYSRLFSLFEKRISWTRMLPLTIVFYFVQVINGALAGGVFALLMQKREGVNWLESGFALLFLGMVDFQVMALLVLIASIIGRHTPLAFTWRYAVAALAVCWTIVAFWLAGPPRAGPARRLYDWHAMSAFRKARLADYLQLAAIRTPIFLAQALALYLDLRAFGIGVAPIYVFTLTPAILLLTALPLTPIGIGTEQAAVALGFGAYAPKATLLAMSLAMSGMGLMLRFCLAPLAVREAIPLLPGDEA